MSGMNEAPEIVRPDTIAAKILFAFDGSGSAWHTVNDDVMGGVSSGMVSIDGETQRLVFSGNLSLENNGGFASARTQWLNDDLTGYDGIILRVRGDGRTYQFRVRTEEGTAKTNYTMLFETEPDTWRDIYISFADMTPIYRGVVRQASVLDPGSIRSLGFMLADKQAGEFLLEVKMLSAVTAGNPQGGESDFSGRI
ncbi:MAG: CIA30 family protein [Chloroflexota bacterium]